MTKLTNIFIYEYQISESYYLQRIVIMKIIIILIKIKIMKKKIILIPMKFLLKKKIKMI